MIRSPEEYERMKLVANKFKFGKNYTPRNVLFLLDKYYRKEKDSREEWIERANKAFDLLLEWRFLVFVDGFYIRKKGFYDDF